MDMRLVELKGLTVLLYPLALYPFVGTLISAGLKGLGIATYLHKPVGL